MEDLGTPIQQIGHFGFGRIVFFIKIFGEQLLFFGIFGQVAGSLFFVGVYTDLWLLVFGGFETGLRAEVFGDIPLNFEFLADLGKERAFEDFGDPGSFFGEDVQHFDDPLLDLGVNVLFEDYFVGFEVLLDFGHVSAFEGGFFVEEFVEKDAWG